MTRARPDSLITPEELVAVPARPPTTASWRVYAGVAVVGLLLLHVSNPAVWLRTLPGWWFPPAGVGVVLVAWLGWRAAMLVVLDTLLVAVQTKVVDAPSAWGDGFPSVLGPFWDASILGLEVLALWGLYFTILGGARMLGDPRSAATFLIAVGALLLGFAFLHALPLWIIDDDGQPLLADLIGRYWLSHSLGVLAVAPLLLVTQTPWLTRRGLIPVGPAPHPRDRDEPRPLSSADVVELTAITVGIALFSLFQSFIHLRPDVPQWHLWVLPLLLIVMASLRQGLRGGTLTASSATGVVLILFGLIRREVEPDPVWQVNLLGQCAAALLVAGAGNWMRQSETRYRQVVTRIPVVLYSARVTTPAPDSRTPPRAELTFVSPASRALLGAEPEELVGEFRRWLGRVHPEDREILLAAQLQIGLQRDPVVCEYRLFQPADDPETPLPGALTAVTASLGGLRSAIKQTYGSRVISFAAPIERSRWVRDTMAPHFGPSGALEGWDGVVSDITEQRALADDLRRTTNMFHALVANLPAGVFFVHGTEGIPILVNTRARQLLGRHEDRTAGLARLVETYRLRRPDGSPYPTDDLPVVAALRHGTSTMCDDIVVHRPDGQRLPLIAWGAPVDLGGRHDAAVWVFEDLTELKQAHDVVLASEERYRVLVETLPILLVQFDRVGRATYLNPTAQGVTGFAADDLSRAGSWDALVHADDRPAAHQAFAEALSGRTARLEARYGAKDGRELVGYAIVEPRFEDHTIAGVTVLLVDMTRERRLEQELQRAQRLELIGRVSSGIAHDFNNLLTVVMTLTQLAQLNLVAEHPVQDDLRKIVYATEQAANLAHQLLAFSKNRRAEPRRVDLNRVAERTLELLRATLPKAIHIDAHLAEGELPVLADEMQLQQVLMNLCLNARDAMPQGGRLGVSTVRATDDVLLTVADDGAGIPDDVLAHIFDPFFSTKEHGTGLGLAVVRQIVEAGGGRVEVRSKPGAGSRFDVRLPRHA